MRINLKQKVKSTPKSSGIYIFSKGRQKLYIGKAANLRSRLKNYLNPTDPRIKKMLLEADKISFQKTTGDIEALILESQLIKKWRPRFNIMLRDDKQYFYVGFSDDEFSKIFLTHQPLRNNQQNEFIGPFTDGSALKITLRELRKIFPYCTCKQPHYNFCLNYHIGKCLGFCCLKNHEKYSMKYETKIYNKNINAIKDILNGKRKSLIKSFIKEMEESAKSGNLDKAIELRDKTKKIKRVFENANLIKNSPIFKKATDYGLSLAKILKIDNLAGRIEGYDISNVQGQYAVGAMVVFNNGQPDKNAYRKFKIKTASGVNDPAMIREILERRFNHPDWEFPEAIIIDGGKSQTNTVDKILTERRINIPIVGLTKDERHFGNHLVLPGRKSPIALKKLCASDRNLLLQIDAEAHRFAISYYRHLHSKSIQCKKRN